MAPRKIVDWEAVGVDHRAGILSLREVARQHGVDVGYLHRKAKKNGWTRDLTARIQHEVNRKLVNATVNVSDAVIVDSESDKLVQVQQLHRRDINSQREIAATLIAELGDNKARIKVDKDGNQVEVQLTLKERSEIFRNITQAAARYIPLERQAYSLDNFDENAEKLFIDLGK